MTRSARLGLLLLTFATAAAADPLPPLARGDETIVATRHQIDAGDRALRYEARAGRLPIRNDETGEIRRDGRDFPISYLPRGETVQAWQWERVPGVPDSRCMR